MLAGTAILPPMLALAFQMMIAFPKEVQGRQPSIPRTTQAKSYTKAPDVQRSLDCTKSSNNIEDYCQCSAEDSPVALRCCNENKTNECFQKCDKGDCSCDDAETTNAHNCVAEHDGDYDWGRAISIANTGHFVLIASNILLVRMLN